MGVTHGTLKIKADLSVFLKDNNDMTEELARNILDKINFDNMEVNKEEIIDDSINFEIEVSSPYTHYYEEAYFSRSFGNWLPPESNFECEIDEEFVRDKIKKSFKNYEIDLYVHEAVTSD